VRCPQCGNDTQQGATFCARCGTRLFAPKPANVREYALAVWRPSLWYYANGFLVGGVVIAVGGRVLYAYPDQWRGGMGLFALGGLMFIVAVVRSRSINWNLTSDRLIEKRGLVASRRREMELADIRSVEVSQRVVQRLLGLGDITIASAASADYAIRLNDIGEPNLAAETIRKARLKRLA
jgi:membrane protein YdbS with pleckstrin-like domain